MTAESDRFVYDDAAYVLGALSEDERREFEAHLATCADCRARVAEVQDVPRLLADVTAADLADDPVPDTLLPGLLRRAHRRRSRQRWLVAGVSAVAAACLVTLVVLVWPFGSSDSTSTPTARPFVAVQETPVEADAALVSKVWGTQIDVHCSYAESISESFPYVLRVYGTDGASEDLGSWKVPVGHDMSYQTGTRLSVDEISKLEILKTDGTPVLELDN